MDIMLNPTLVKYASFAETNDKKTVGTLKIKGRDGTFSVCPCREKGTALSAQRTHNRARDVFFDAVVKQFGGADKIPQKVREALYGKDVADANPELWKKPSTYQAHLRREFLTGKPLEARHIQKVVNAIKADVNFHADKILQDIHDFCEHRDAENFQKAVKDFFKAALPPHWRSSTNYAQNALSQFCKTVNIREAESNLGEIIDPADLMQEDEATIREVIRTKLNLLTRVFEYSKQDKRDHVNAFQAAFSRACGEGNDIRGKFGHDYRFMTDAERFGDTPVDTEKTYGLTEQGATDFVRDLFRAAHQADGFEFDRDSINLEFEHPYGGPDSGYEKDLKGKLRDRTSPLFSWLLVKMLNSCSVKNISKGTCDIGLVLYRTIREFKVDNNDTPSQQIKAFFKFFKKQLNDYVDADQYVGQANHREWIENVISKVESIDLEYITDSLTQQGAWSKVGTQDLDDIEKIARCACGSTAGSNGGAGYMGLLPGGVAFKCLKKGTQRLFVGSGLSEVEKAKVTQATRALRNRLVTIAKKINLRTATYVSRLLEVTKEGGVELLLRTNVAKALSYMAPALIAEDGRRFDWSQINAINESYSSLRDVAEAVDVEAAKGGSNFDVDYAKRKNEYGIVFSFGEFKGVAAKTTRAWLPKINQIADPHYVAKMAKKPLLMEGETVHKTALGEFIKNVKNNLKNSAQQPDGIPLQFKRDATRADAFVMPDKTSIKPVEIAGPAETRICDLLAEKLAGKQTYAELDGNDRRFVQLAMSIMNQGSFNVSGVFEMAVSDDLGGENAKFTFMSQGGQREGRQEHQIHRNKDGSVTFKGFVGRHVGLLAFDSGNIQVPLNGQKSYRSYSYEITFSAEQLEKILNSDWNDLAPEVLGTDNLKFYYTCHLDASNA